MGRKKYKQAVRSTSLNKSQEQSLKIKSNISSIKDEVSNEDRKESSEDLCTNNMIPNETNNEDDQGSAVQLEAPKSDLSNIISTPLYRTVDLETQDAEYMSDDSTDDSIVTVIENRSSSESLLENGDAYSSDSANIAKYADDLKQLSTEDSESKLEFNAHAEDDQIKVIVDLQSNNSLSSEQSFAKENKNNPSIVVLNNQLITTSLAVKDQKKSSILTTELKSLGIKKERSRSLGDTNSTELTSDAKSFQSEVRATVRKNLPLANKLDNIDQCLFAKVRNRYIKNVREILTQLREIRDKSTSCPTTASNSKQLSREPKERICSHCLQKHRVVDKVGSIINQLHPELALIKSKMRDKINTRADNSTGKFRSFKPTSAKDKHIDKNKDVEGFTDYQEKINKAKNYIECKDIKKEREDFLNQLINATENNDVKKMTELNNHMQEHDKASSNGSSSYDKINNNENKPNDTQKFKSNSQKTNLDLLPTNNKEQKLRYQERNNQIINEPLTKSNSKEESEDFKKQITAMNNKNQESINLLVSASNKTNKEEVSQHHQLKPIVSAVNNKNKREESKNNQQKSDQAVGCISSPSTTESNSKAIKKELGKSYQALKHTLLSMLAGRNKGLRSMLWSRYCREKYNKSPLSINSDEKPTAGHITKVTCIPGVGPYEGLMIPEFAFMDFSHITCQEVVQTSNKKKKMFELQEVLNNKQEAKTKEQIGYLAVQGKLERHLKVQGRMEKTDIDNTMKKLKQDRRSQTSLLPEDVDDSTPWFSEWKQDGDNCNVLVAYNK